MKIKPLKEFVSDGKALLSRPIVDDQVFMREAKAIVDRFTNATQPKITQEKQHDRNA